MKQYQRPAILVGGGVHKDRELFRALAEKLNIPCFRTWNALDIVTDDLPQYAGTVGTYGGPGRNFGIQNCDLLISLGCRISGRITGGLESSFARSADRIVVDVDRCMLDNAVHTQSPVADVMREWMDNPPAVGNADWMARCRDWVTRYDPVKPEMLTGKFHHYGFMRQLSEMLPDNAIVVSDTGGNQIMMGHCFRSKWGQRIFSSNGNSPMGFSMCGAIGAWFAQPERPIICIIGDGGMQMNIQELQTIAHYKVPVKVFVINNGILGNTKSFQIVNGKKQLACGPDGYSAPDFYEVCVGYGLDARTVRTWYDCDRLPAVLRHREAQIIDVQDFERCTYEPRVSRWDCGIEEMYPPLPANEFRSNMIIEPLPGWEKRRVNLLPCVCGTAPNLVEAGPVNFVVQCPKCGMNSTTVGTAEHVEEWWNDLVSRRAA